jgi:hypothetical protein
MDDGVNSGSGEPKALGDTLDRVSQAHNATVRRALSAGLRPLRNLEKPLRRARSVLNALETYRQKKGIWLPPTDRNKSLSGAAMAGVVEGAVTPPIGDAAPQREWPGSQREKTLRDRSDILTATASAATGAKLRRVGALVAGDVRLATTPDTSERRAQPPVGGSAAPTGVGEPRSPLMAATTPSLSTTSRSRIKPKILMMQAKAAPPASDVEAASTKGAAAPLGAYDVSAKRSVDHDGAVLSRRGAGILTTRRLIDFSRPSESDALKVAATMRSPDVMRANAAEPFATMISAPDAAAVRSGTSAGTAARPTSVSPGLTQAGAMAGAGPARANDAAAPRDVGEMPSNSSSMHGDVYLDGALMGRWMSRALAREAGRPSAGGSGFDARRSPLPAGRMIGG